MSHKLKVRGVVRDAAEFDRPNEVRAQLNEIFGKLESCFWFVAEAVVAPVEPVDDSGVRLVATIIYGEEPPRETKAQWCSAMDEARDIVNGLWRRGFKIAPLTDGEFF